MSQVHAFPQHGLAVFALLRPTSCTSDTVSTAHLSAVYIVILDTPRASPMQRPPRIIRRQPLAVAMQQPARADGGAAWWGAWQCWHTPKMCPVAEAGGSCIVAYASTPAGREQRVQHRSWREVMAGFLGGPARAQNVPCCRSRWQLHYYTRQHTCGETSAAQVTC
jgi:hypothetical protein